MKTGLIIALSMASFAGMILMMYLTHPGEVGPFGVLTFFILLYVFCSGIIYLGLNVIKKIATIILPKGFWKMRLEGLSSIKVYYFTSVLAFAPVVLLGMASVGGLKMWDIGLVLLFEALACFYVAHRF